MIDVLDQPRDIMIGGEVETFRDYAYLVERGEVFIETMQQIEAGLDARPADAAADWARLAKLAALLGEVLAAQEQWLADADAALACEIEAARSDIRKLNLSTVTKDQEPGA